MGSVLDKLPMSAVEHTLTTFLTPLLNVLPDRRLQRVVPLAVRGILVLLQLDGQVQ